jgi:hypothetical protein
VLLGMLAAGHGPLRARGIGNALLEQRLAGGAVDVALQHSRPVPELIDHGSGEVQIEPDLVELREAPLWEEHLAGIQDAHLPAGRVGDRVICHPLTG